MGTTNKYPVFSFSVPFCLGLDFGLAMDKTQVASMPEKYLDTGLYLLLVFLCLIQSY